MWVPTVFGADDQVRTDLLLRQTGGQQGQDLLLAVRERGRSVDGSLGRGRAGTTQGPPDAREQLVGIERLHQVVVGAEQQAGHAIGGIGPAAGDEDDREIVAVRLVELAAELVAARVGQIDLEDDELERLVHACAELCRGRDGLHPAAEPSQDPPQ